MLTNYLTNMRHIGRDARLMIAAQGIMGFAYLGIYSVLFNLYLLRLGYDAAYIGQINAIGRMGFALLGVPAGLLGVRFGPRPLLIAGAVIMVIGLVGAPLGDFLPPAIWGQWISLFFFFGYVGGALFFVNATPYLMAVSGQQERSHLFSALGALMPLTSFAGSLTGGLLPGLASHLLGVTDANPAAYRYPLVFAGGLFLCTLPLIIATRPSAEQSGNASTNPLRDIRIAPLGTISALAGVMFLASIGLGITGAFFNIYLDDGLGVTTALIGTVTALTQLLAAPAAMLIPMVVVRFGHIGGIQWPRVIMALAWVPMALIQSLEAATLTMLVITATSSISAQIFTIYSQLIIDTRWRTLMSGVLSTTMGFAWVVTTWVGGHIIENWGYSTLFLLGAASTALTLAAFSVVAQQQQKC